MRKFTTASLFFELGLARFPFGGFDREADRRAGRVGFFASPLSEFSPWGARLTVSQADPPAISTAPT
jgi:hypothetical protein